MQALTDDPRSCPFCTASGISETFVLEERFYGTRERFSYGLCRSCGSLYILDEDLDLSKYYPSTYYSYSTSERPGILGYIDRRYFRKLYESHLTLLRRAGANVDRGSRIYDVGSGAGSLLRAMARDGFENVHGIDPYVRADVATSDIEILRASINTVADQRPASADIVMFNHSLEHIADPIPALIAARRLLAPGGVVLLRIPVLNFAWEKYGEFWYGLDAPRHLGIPTPQGVHACAAKAGFEVALVHYDSNAQQFTASEAYAKGRSFVEAFSASAPRTLLRMITTLGYQIRARRLNAEQRGDQAAFLLRAL